MKGVVLDDVALQLADDDTVATALTDLEAGHRIDDGDVSIELVEAVSFGHKVALTAMERGDPVTKYGEVIGRTTSAVEPGEWVHTHNCESTRGRGDLSATEVE